MLIFGGYAENVANSPDVYKLDLCHFEWSLVRCSDEPPLYRDFHTATAIGNRMYIFGGRSDNQFWHNQSEFYSDKLVYLVRTYLFHRMFAIMCLFKDLTTLRWEQPSIPSPKPKGRRSHSALNLNGNLLIFGGYNGKLQEHMNDLWLLDTVNWRWRQLHPHGKGPEPRRRQALCKVVSRDDFCYT